MKSETNINVTQLIRKSTESLADGVFRLAFNLEPYLNQKTGIATGFSLQLLVREMWVEKVQGRKVKPVTNETIRSYFRTMNKCSNGKIQVTTKNKKISVYFPLIEEAYKNFNAQNKEYVEKNITNTQENIMNNSISDDLTVERNTQQTTQEYATSKSELYINKNKIINKNNKIFIALDFEPTQETIETALSKNLPDVLSQETINDFIEWNASRNNQHTQKFWQKKFVEWLEKSANYNANKQKNTGMTRNAITTTNSPIKPKFNSIIDEVQYNCDQLQEQNIDLRQAIIDDKHFFDVI